jgi:hypothetical protein
VTQLCERCGHYYDDEQSWTICPHGPLWAPAWAYCREHDLVHCKLHGDGTRPYVAPVSGVPGAEYRPTAMFQAYKPNAALQWLQDVWWDCEHYVMGRLGFSWSVQNGWQRRTKVT